MKITSITITDLAGFPGTVTFPLYGVSLALGPHGSGKSSLGEVLCYAFGRRPLSETGSVGVRHDPSLLRSDKGEAIIEFDDGSLFRCYVTTESTTRTIKAPGGTKWNKATPEFIDSLVNALSYDPFVFKSLPEKQRIEALLKASPITVSTDEFLEAVGPELRKYIIGEPSLESINATFQNLYEYRRTANVAADTHAKHAGELEATLPKEDVAAVDVAPLRAQKEALEREETSLIARLRAAIDKESREQNDAHVRRKDEIDRDINAKIAALETERLNRALESQKRASNAIAEAKRMSNDAVIEHRKQAAPKLESITAEIATAEERALRAATDKGARDAAKKARDAQAAAQADSQRIDAAMSRLKTLKESVAGRLAVKGITIASPKAGQPVDICRDEAGIMVPFSRWNESDKEIFCLRMAVLFHGKCGIVFVDEIGHFTEERRKAVLDRAKVLAKEEGMQFVFGMASEGDLRVVEG